mgnify:CR=1 FL=1
MTLERLPNESAQDHKFRLLLDKAKGDSDYGWKEIEEVLNLGINHTTIRTGTYFLPEYEAYIKSKQDNIEEVKAFKYKETVEVKSDGSTSSDKLIAMSEEQSKDSSFLLKAHGFNPEEFDLTNAKSSMWNVGSEGRTLYSSKITVKPKANGINYYSLIERLNKDVVKAIPYESTKLPESDKMLQIPLFDMHFGIADLEYYKETMMKIEEKIVSRKWDKIVFIIGQDLLHNDNFRGTTTSGTVIDKVNMEEAFADAQTFYSHLINVANAHSNNTHIVFSSGNHDESLGWAFVKVLEAKFENIKTITFDTSMKPRKAIVWKDVFIGTAHGDRSGNKLTKNFYTEFGKQIAQAELAEIWHGHLHHEKSKDELGLVVRCLATKAKTDEYHDINGWIGANKRFQLFEFSPNSLDTIYYV